MGRAGLPAAEAMTTTPEMAISRDSMKKSSPCSHRRQDKLHRKAHIRIEILLMLLGTLEGKKEKRKERKK